ncbi:MAG: hypothetical protein MMC33_000577 [Icmadophila ericetorum]|nr:hypothetical protein [Icmadophila ericetorum]
MAKESARANSRLSILCYEIYTNQARGSLCNDIWYDILTLYSGRAITREHDRLPTLSGLANELAELLGDEYVVGLGNVILLGVFYGHVQDGREKEMRACQVAQRHFGLGHPLHVGPSISTLQSDMHRMISLKTLNSYGEVFNASIEVTGFLKETSPTTDTKDVDAFSNPILYDIDSG